jgi:putative transposase
MLRHTPFAIGETYHIYNRGAHKANVFTNDSDYRRFLSLLFLMNGAEPIRLGRLLANRQGQSLPIFEEKKPNEPLVDILAYALMPNHFHIVVRQKSEQGITKFFKKVLTGYSMYFNIKYQHSGILFQGPFKSVHVDNDSYFRWIFSYLHLNPLSLIEPGWEEKGITDVLKVREFMNSYQYSSYLDYKGDKRPESIILTTTNLPDFLKTDDLEDLLESVGKDSPRPHWV